MKNYTGSYTHLFCMAYPWIIVLIIILLDTFKIYSILDMEYWVIITIMTAPVAVAMIWFLIKNYSSKNSKQTHKNL